MQNCGNWKGTFPLTLHNEGVVVDDLVSVTRHEASCQEKRFRILHTESSMGLGGQELRILQEARGMRARGHYVVLVAQPNSQIAQRAHEYGIVTELVKMGRIRWVWLVWVFLRLVSRHAVEIVNTHGSIDSWTASIAGRLSTFRPLVIRTRHKSTPISDTCRHRWLYGKLPHAIVTTGEAVRQSVSRQIKVSLNRIVSIPTGIDMQQFYPTPGDVARRRDLGAQPGDLIIGTVTFLRDYKGLEYLLEAAMLVSVEFPQARFVIVGSGPEYVKLQTRIQDLNLLHSIVMTGHREDIMELLACMDAFVLTSTGGEGVPQALVQAMAMERAVVATDVGGIPELVKHERTGLLVQPKDAVSLASAIRRLLHDEKFREKLGQAARAWVQHSFDIEGMLSRTEAVYADFRDRVSSSPSSQEVKK